MAKVLLVEDDGSVSETLKDVLTQAGHMVDTSVGFKDAKDKLMAGSYDIVVSDYNYKDDMNFPALLDFIESTRKHNPSKVILMSGGGDRGVAERMANEKGIRFIAKPVRNSVLVQAVGEVLGDLPPMPPPMGAARS
jgi:two-component system nitrate/nitrite response regulator NarL